MRKPWHRCRWRLLAAAALASRRLPRAAGIDEQDFGQIERGRYLGDRRRLRRLPYAAGQRPATSPAAGRSRRRSARRSRPTSPRPRDRHRRLDRRRVRQRADQGHRPQRHASLSGDALHLLHQGHARRCAGDPRLSQHRAGGAATRCRPNQLPFPFNMRAIHGGMGQAVLHAREFQPVAGKSAEWNRGAYLVEGLGHCGMCHTPKNVLGGDKTGERLQGYALQGWFAPNITNDSAARPRRLVGRRHRRPISRPAITDQRGHRADGRRRSTFDLADDRRRPARDRGLSQGPAGAEHGQVAPASADHAGR